MMLMKEERVMRRVALGCILVAIACGTAACSRGPRVSPSEVVIASEDALPSDPGDAAWRRAPVHPAPLLLQDLVDPQLLEASTPEVRVQAITDGRRVAFRLAWTDGTKDDVTDSARFSDACAVQLPATIDRDVPAPQMGEPDKAVEITYWRAAWQAIVDGRPDTIREIHPGAAVDHYPFEAPSLPVDSPERRALETTFAPARALGNPMGGPRERPVEDLVAEGPGTTRPAPAARSEGRGRRSETGWEVVLVRPLPEGLGAGTRSQIAFAVWEGAHQEAGARKMRSAWIPMVVEAAR